MTQNMCVKIWDRHLYDLYLAIHHGYGIEHNLNTKFNRDLILISNNLMITQHSDCDGDLLPTFILDYEGQKLLKEFELVNVLEEELEWHEQYKAKEFSSTHDLDVEHKYELHYLSYTDYSTYLTNAVVAKNNIGVSTLDIWSFSMVLEVYQKFSEDNNYMYQKKDGATPLTRISKHEAQLLGYTYTRLVQEFVIEGIKHVSNGSKGFDMYFLKSIGKEENEKKIRSDLTSTFGLSNILVDKLLFIVRFANDNHDLIKGCKNFISLYNKGRFPSDPEALDYWESYISENTYFGSLLKVLFNIKKGYESQAEESTESVDALFDMDFSALLGA